MEGQKELIVSYQQAVSTAVSSRKSRQGEKKEQLIKLCNGLIRQAVGSDSRGRRFNCRKIRRMGKTMTEQSQSRVWIRGEADWAAV